MNIILKSKIKGLGEAFEVVKVKNGYGRNWLLPQGLALPATNANLRQEPGIFHLIKRCSL